MVSSAVLQDTPERAPLPSKYEQLCYVIIYACCHCLCRFPQDYAQTYMHLSTPALFAPYVRLQLLSWDPFMQAPGSHAAFDKQDWWAHVDRGPCPLQGLACMYSCLLNTTLAEARGGIQVFKSHASG